LTDVVPFGKYKDQPVATLLADRNYTDWLVQQDWFKQRYATIYNVVINNSTGTTSTKPCSSTRSSGVRSWTLRCRSAGWNTRSEREKTRCPTIRGCSNIWKMRQRNIANA
jgi:hypothetical protein